jgi:hypothetical protein
MEAKIENRGSYIDIEVTGEINSGSSEQYDKAVAITLDALKLVDQTGINKVFCDAGQATGSIPLHHRLSFSLFIAKKHFERLLKNKRVLKIAFLADQSLLDPSRIGVTITRGRGMNILVTTEKKEALKWLGIENLDVKQVGKR